MSVTKSLIARFFLSGAASLSVAYVVFIVSTEAGVHYLLSSWLGFGAYWIVNFNLHKRWTFKSKGQTSSQAVKHFLMHFINQFLIMAGLFILVDWVGLHYLLANIILTVLVTIEVFILSHFFIFK